ncbi:MAG: hypothetical protein A2X52_16100 [Candidatus Rokubacteria bacterium GWC2_70_16]|nr:MAG: hypothetical protein A2X52_16100 [Candidatus Rokubacteria bacterium GWC2_70_16]
MPAYTVTLPVAAEPAHVWAFVNDYANWADLFPGYQGHRLAPDGRSVWTIKGDLGMFARLVEVEVGVIVGDGSEGARFTVKGLTEKVQAEGAFLTRPLGPGRAELTFVLDVRAGGAMAPMINALLRPALPRMMEGFARSLVTRIESGEVEVPG